MRKTIQLQMGLTNDAPSQIEIQFAIGQFWNLNNSRTFTLIYRNCSINDISVRFHEHKKFESDMNQLYIYIYIYLTFNNICLVSV